MNTIRNCFTDRRRFPAFCDPCEHLVLVNAAIVADTQVGRVLGGDACAIFATITQVGAQAASRGGDRLPETGVADKTRELGAQMDLDVLGVRRFEIPIMRLMEINQDRHDLAEIQTAFVLQAADRSNEYLGFPAWLKDAAKAIDMTEQFE